MSRQVVPLGSDNLSKLPDPCHDCAFWESPPAAYDKVRAARAEAREKQARLSEVERQWGSCGLLALVDGRIAGYLTYAPAGYVPRSAAFPTAPVSDDAVLLIALRVVPEFRGRGIGRLLVQTATRDAARNGMRALEAFGTGDGVASAGRETQPNDAGQRRRRENCLIPSDYLLSLGFVAVRPHPRTPRLRLDIRSLASWREEMGSAVDRLRSGIQSPILSR